MVYIVRLGLFFWGFFVSNCCRRLSNTNKTLQVQVTHHSFVRMEAFLLEGKETILCERFFCFPKVWRC